MTIDIRAVPAQMSAAIEPPDLPPSSAVVYHPAADPDAEPHIAARAPATRVQGRAMPVTECGCCGATIGPMLPSEVDCPSNAELQYRHTTPTHLRIPSDAEKNSPRKV
jgi:hypothetical protein